MAEDLLAVFTVICGRHRDVGKKCAGHRYFLQISVEGTPDIQAFLYLRIADHGAEDLCPPSLVGDRCFSALREVRFGEAPYCPAREGFLQKGPDKCRDCRCRFFGRDGDLILGPGNNRRDADVPLSGRIVVELSGCFCDGAKPLVLFFIRKGGNHDVVAADQFLEILGLHIFDCQLLDGCIGKGKDLGREILGNDGQPESRREMAGFSNTHAPCAEHKDSFCPSERSAVGSGLRDRAGS